MHEKCGVAAVMDLEDRQNVVPMVRKILEELQHRGQMGAGIAWIIEQTIKKMIGVYKELGLVKDVFAQPAFRDMHAQGSVAIGHTRYATSARGQGSDLCHPYYYPANGRQQAFAFAFNGNIPDYEPQLAMLRSAGIQPHLHLGDTEIIGQMIAQEMRDDVHESTRAAIQEALSQFDGALNTVLLSSQGSVYATRDPFGFHPLAYAQNGSLVAVASEDSALRALWPQTQTYNVGPGQILHISRKHGISVHQAWKPTPASCFMEWVYFAERETTIDGVPVPHGRQKCGRELALLDAGRPDTDIVVPVPESAKIAADGYADARRLRRVDVLLRQPGTARTFIENGNREEKILQKFDIDSRLVAGQSIILMDDSMVRGTTMGVLIGLLREKGAAEVHVRLASPPILAPCFYGIDFPTVKELIARKYHTMPLGRANTLPPDVLEAIARDIGADSIAYLPASAVPVALGVHKDTLCMACVTGKYPTPDGRRLYQLEEGKQGT